MAGSLIAASALLAACSDVPDALNPVAWWDGVFGDDEPAQAQSVKAAPAAAAAPTAQTAQNQAAPGADQSFPTLQEVPEKPVTSTVEQRRQMMQGLASDRANAHYSDESARATAAAPSAEAAASAAPAPSGVPSSAGAPAGAPSSAGASSAAGPAASSKDTGLELMPDSAASAPPVPPPSATGRKSYLSGADTGPEPAAPPAPEKSAPAPAMAEKGSAPPAKGGAVTPPAPGSSELNQVYAAKLKESAPTVSTTPVGPLANGAAPAAGSVAEPPVAAETPATSQGALAFGKSASPSVEVFDGALSGPDLSGAPGQLGTVYFGNGSAELDEGDLAELRQITAVYKQRGGNIRVVGYASSYTVDMDPVHHQMINFTISVRRADAVARELTKLGVKPGNILVSARSDSEPIYYESMPAGRAGNQRTEIFIDY